MKKLNKNGFTLIELLAVIVIMGILMMVAIPAMTRYIENSRKDTFLTTAKEYVNATRNMWASDSLICNTGDSASPRIVSSGVDAGDWYVVINTKDEDAVNLLDQGGKSSWGNRDVQGYVRVHITEDTTGSTERKTQYYVALSDGTHGIKDTVSAGTESDELIRSDVKSTNVKYSDVKPGLSGFDFGADSSTMAHVCIEN